VYLLGERVCWSKIAVALTVDGWLSTPTNGIHFPVGVVIVHHVEVTMPAPETRGNRGSNQVTKIVLEMCN
jgi:hypothetical protein